MPSYAEPFAKAGAAGGAGFMGTLGRMLEPLDWARQSVWNLPGKLAEGDWGAALPGLLGAGAGLGLAATGVGAPLAALLGSAVGGVGQGIGKSMDEERFAAPTGDDAIKALGGDADSTGGQVGSFLLQALGDPLTYAGGFKGGQAGRNYGRGLEEVAAARGPRYPGGMEKFVPGNVNDVSFAEMFGGEHGQRLLGEIPPGSKLIGSGVEAKGYAAPSGDHIIRIGGGPGTMDLRRLAEEQLAAEKAGFDFVGLPSAPHPRPDMPELIQPSRSVAIGPYRVEHVPSLETVTRETATTDIPMIAGQQELIKQLESRGLQAATHPQGLLAGGGDLHMGNIGRTAEGRVAAFDPGAVLPPPGTEMLPGNVGVVGGDNQGTRMQNWLLDMLGSDKSVRRELEQGLAGGAAGRGVPVTQDMIARQMPSQPPHLATINVPGGSSSPLLAERVASSHPATVNIRGGQAQRIATPDSERQLRAIMEGRPEDHQRFLDNIRPLESLPHGPPAASPLPTFEEMWGPRRTTSSYLTEPLDQLRQLNADYPGELPIGVMEQLMQQYGTHIPGNSTLAGGRMRRIGTQLTTGAPGTQLGI